ncbi:MAG: TadE/TadG family type IV pilus assembly protein [Solirubrobacteraceae bacterium]
MSPRSRTSRLRAEDGQAVIEFALVLPLLVAFILLVADMGRLFNAYNDLNQMAADGARFAAVGNFPGAAALLQNADTAATKSASVTGPAYSAGSCVVGSTVTVRTSATISFFPMLGVASVPLTGSSQMRVERCP